MATFKTKRFKFCFLFLLSFLISYSCFMMDSRQSSALNEDSNISVSVDFSDSEQEIATFKKEEDITSNFNPKVTNHGDTLEEFRVQIDFPCAKIATSIKDFLFDTSDLNPHWRETQKIFNTQKKCIAATYVYDAPLLINETTEPIFNSIKVIENLNGRILHNLDDSIKIEGKVVVPFEASDDYPGGEGSNKTIVPNNMPWTSDSTNITLAIASIALALIIFYVVKKRKGAIFIILALSLCALPQIKAEAKTVNREFPFATTLSVQKKFSATYFACGGTFSDGDDTSKTEVVDYSESDYGITWKVSDDKQSVVYPIKSDEDGNRLAFAGYYSNEDCTFGRVYPGKEIVEDSIFYAKWEPLGDFWIATKDAGLKAGDTTTPETAKEILTGAQSLGADSDLIAADSEGLKGIYDYYASLMLGTVGNGDNDPDAFVPERFHLYSKLSDSTIQDEKDKYIEARIVGLAHDRLSDDLGAAGITFEAAYALPKSYKMNDTATTEGGWASSQLHGKINSQSGEVLNLFNQKFKESLFACDIDYANHFDSDSTSQTSDKLWLPSFAEIAGESYIPYGGDHPHPYAKEGSQYEYFKGVGISFDKENASLTNMGKTRSNAFAEPAQSDAVWMRSLDSELAQRFSTIDKGDVTYRTEANKENTIAPCFTLFTSEEDPEIVPEPDPEPGSDIRVVYNANGGHFGSDATATKITETGDKTSVTISYKADGTGADAQIIYPIREKNKKRMAFAGWYALDSNNDLTVRVYPGQTLTKSTTLFAKWEELGDFWLATKGAGVSDSTTPERAAEILAGATSLADDANKVAVSNQGDNAAYDYYESIMKGTGGNGDKSGKGERFHLYTKLNDGSLTNVKDKYLEARIVDLDREVIAGSVPLPSKAGITWQAIHSLPNTYAMDATKFSTMNWGVNAGGWGMAPLREALNSTSGTIHTMFKTGFIDALKEVEVKFGTTFNADTLSTSTDKLWVASFSELASSADPSMGIAKNYPYDKEGEQLSYWASKGIKPYEQNASLIELCKSRSGVNLKESWMRSCATNGDDTPGGYFYLLNGNPSLHGAVCTNRGVTVCFAL